MCLACHTTALNFLAITIFQATGKKVQPLILSLLHKGGLDIPLMLVFRTFIGIGGICHAGDSVTMGKAAIMALWQGF